MQARRDEADPYELLCVARDATPSAIRAAYRRLAAACHPDTHPGAEANARMARLNAAWQVLGDASRRAQHDAEHAPCCAGCGLRMGLFAGACRVCLVQDAPSARSSPEDPRRFNAALWSVQVHAPLETCAALVSVALGPHAPELAQRESEISDRKFEASIALGPLGDLAELGARLWIDDPTRTTLRVSLAADLPWGEGRGEHERGAFDRLALAMAGSLESALKAGRLVFEPVA